MSDYTLLATVRAVLTDTTAYPNADVSAAITRATARIDAFAGVFFDSRAKTLYLDGGDAATLELVDRDSLGNVAAARIQSVSSVVRNDGVTSSTFTTSDYIARAGEFQIRLRSGEWQDGVENIEVTGTFGWATVPADVDRAAVLLAVRDLEESRMLTASKFEKDAKIETLGQLQRSVADHVFDFTESTGDADADRLLLPFRRRNSLHA